MRKLRTFLYILSYALTFTASSAQDGNLLAIKDTSYFIPGSDDENLLESVIRNEPGNVHLLLNRGANPDVASKDDITALMLAVDSTKLLVMRLLLVNGADPDLTYYENTTPLILAVLNNQFAAADLLLQKGADPDLKDDYKAAALHYAAASNYYQMADLLLFYGADKEITDKDGNDPLMTAVFFNAVETTDVLLQNTLNPDKRDEKGNTPLMVAAQQGNTDIAKLFLEYNADVNAVNKNNQTALAFAIRYQHPEMLKLLIENGADVNHAVTPNRNMMEMARQMKNKDIINELKKNGARRTVTPDFSEISISWGNSLGYREYMMQVRGAWVDKRYGFYAETGIDWRPAPFRVQIRENDTLLYQYRQSRIGWCHGIGKKITFTPSNTNTELGVYAAMHGLLSFPRHRGLENHPSAQYNLIPSAGLYAGWSFVGAKLGVERYYFKTRYEQKWKVNLTLFVRFSYNNVKTDYKQIYY